MTDIFRTWLDRVEQERIGHHQVIQLTRAIWPLSRGFEPAGKRTSMRKAEAQAIVMRLQQRHRQGNGIRATDDNEERGRQWLRSNQRRFGLPMDFDPLTIIEFRLVGFHIYAHDNRWNTVAGAPVWRAYLPDGRTFDYAPTAWQASMRKDAPPLWWRMNERRAA